jgi:sodium transport system permease protein
MHLKSVFIVFIKELKDILRDKRSLFTVSLLSILAGPVMMLLMANMIAQFEVKSERRVVLVDGIEHAPSLKNHLLQETTLIQPAPKNYRLALSQGKLEDPVLVIPEGFEQQWLDGVPQTLTIITDSSNGRAHAGVGRLKRWLSALSNDRSTMEIALAGIAPYGMDYLNIEEHDLANPLAEAANVFGMIPYFLVLAALYSVWGSALETTISEKEKGTYESLLITPIPIFILMLGKWLAIFVVGSFISMAAIMSFMATEALMVSDTLKSMFSFGLQEAFICFLLILPLTGFFAALIMFIGASAKSIRQAQTNTTLMLLVVAFVPMMSQLNSGEITSFQYWLPVASQHFLIK